MKHQEKVVKIKKQASRPALPIVVGAVILVGGFLILRGSGIEPARPKQEMAATSTSPEQNKVPPKPAPPWDSMEVNDAVMVVPIMNEHILLVREYCVGVEDYLLGFAKGLIDPGEEMLVAANRELQEEVGYGARHLEHLTSMTMNPGYTNQHTHIVKATDLYPSILPGDEPEPLEVVHWPLNDLDGLIRRADFTESRSIAALMWLK